LAKRGLRAGTFKFENFQRIVIPKGCIMLEESAVALLAESRFLADKASLE